MAEIWKPVRGFEASHEVSSEGRVRTVKRSFEGGRQRLDGSPSTMTVRPKVLATRLTERGYLAVDLSCGKRRRGRAVHCVVAEAFIGLAPSRQHEVNHKDGDKLNNAASNVEWLTPSENSQHAYDTGLKPVMRGVEVNTAKLDDQSVRRIRALLATGLSQRQVAAQFGVAPSQIARIATWKGWSHVS